LSPPVSRSIKGTGPGVHGRQQRTHGCVDTHTPSRCLPGTLDAAVDESIRGSLCLCSKPAPQTDALNATSGTDVDTGCSTQSGCASICILSHRQGKEEDGKVKLLLCPWVFTERGRSWQQTVDDVIVQGPGESKSKAAKLQSCKASCQQCRAGRRQVDGRLTAGILYYTALPTYLVALVPHDKTCQLPSARRASAKLAASPHRALPSALESWGNTGKVDGHA
jgi:hypothetical protein